MRTTATECTRYVFGDISALPLLKKRQMAHLIYAAVDSRSADWTDYTSASSAYYPETVSAHSSSLDGEEAHLPGYMRTASASEPHRHLDDHVLRAIRRALPAVPDVCSRPSASLPEMGVWSCPQCGSVIDPWNLRLKEKGLIQDFLGVGVDSGLVVATDGRVQLDRRNPWQFMRCVDSLAWSHYSDHLKSVHVIFWYPNPAVSYKVSTFERLKNTFDRTVRRRLLPGSGGTKRLSRSSATLPCPEPSLLGNVLIETTFGCGGPRRCCPSLVAVSMPPVSTSPSGDATQLPPERRWCGTCSRLGVAS